MIPEFPEFKKLELSDREEIEKLTSKFPPYSDFNFVSMWSWDIKGEIRLSMLNSNLTVRFTDYLTGELFYSFLGDSKVDESAETLMKFSFQEGFKFRLKLVPQVTAELLDKEKLKVKEDVDHFDYIYDLARLWKMEGGLYAKKRNQVANFLKTYPEAFAKEIDLREKAIQASIINLSMEWLKKKMDKEDIFESHEEVAISRMLLALEDANLVGVGVFIKEKMIAFMINELTSSQYVIAHASKIDRSFVGVNSFLIKKNSEILYSKNKVFFNYEQDLGVPSLRDAKSRFRPVFFLKKYQLTSL